MNFSIRYLCTESMFSSVTWFRLLLSRLTYSIKMSSPVIITLDGF